MQTELFDSEEFDKKPTPNTKTGSGSKSVFEEQQEFLTRKYGSDWYRDDPRNNSKKRKKKRRGNRR